MDNFGARNNFDGGFGDEEVATPGGADEAGVLEGGADEAGLLEGEIQLLENWAGVLQDWKIKVLENWARVLKKIWSFIQGLYNEAGIDGLRQTFQDELRGCVGGIKLGVRNEDWGRFCFWLEDQRLLMNIFC